MAYNATSEEFLPFQETTRRRRKHGIETMAGQLPLKAFVFDILYKDGVSLLDTPLAERLKVLEETLHPADDTFMLTGSHTMKVAHALTLLFDEATGGCDDRPGADRTVQQSREAMRSYWFRFASSWEVIPRQGEPDETTDRASHIHSWGD